MAAHRPPARTTLPRRPSRGGAAAAPGLLYWPNYIFGTRRHAGADGRWLNEYLRPTKDVAAYEGCTDLSVVCCTRGAVDALDVVDWDALFQLSTRQAKRRLLFGTNTRQRRRRRAADVFWLWDDGLQQLQRRSWSRGLEPRQTAKRLRAGHDVVGSYRARTMEATRRRAGCAHASITVPPRLGFDNQPRSCLL